MQIKISFLIYLQQTRETNLKRFAVIAFLALAFVQTQFSFAGTCTCVPSRPGGGGGGYSGGGQYDLSATIEYSNLCAE